MTAFILTLLLQSALLLPPRTVVENPSTVSQIPPKLQKDYAKLWGRFVSAKEDAKLLKDLDKFIQKNKAFDPAWMIQGYLHLYKGDDGAARQKFNQALALSPKNRIAMYYLAELAYAHGEYDSAATLYAQLQAIDPNHPEIETKRQKAYLLATDGLVRAAARAESANLLKDAEELYRQALKLAPNEPVLLTRLADLLMKQNRKEEADALRKTSEDLLPRHSAKTRVAEEGRDDLEDLGRWGGDIEAFHQIRDAEAISREQFVILLVRYFPQLAEFRQTPQIVTDIQDSALMREIQTVVNVGLMDPLPNRDFQPSQPLSRGDFALALARLSRLLGAPSAPPPPVSPPDVAVSNAMYGEIQLVLSQGLLTLEDSGNFNGAGQVPGRQAVDSLSRLLRIFQQEQR